MEGKIFNSDGQYVADIRANAIYDLAGKRLYHLRGQKIYKPTGELVGHLNSVGGTDGWINRPTDCSRKYRFAGLSNGYSLPRRSPCAASTAMPPELQQLLH